MSQNSSGVQSNEVSLKKTHRIIIESSNVSLSQKVVIRGKHIHELGAVEALIVKYYHF